ncbi:hypothetical protein E1A91_A11G273800v1 [Gossypium mustelinum]|uniref:Uncharacterized protein n=1 Tax=Gossypium mustelinum TaxID=34275 RepID=A0A5D2XCE3_GOSMU|nr:hypothetical protein E1A91_A11G273800v1 [Gossypium mustelinum]
MAAQPQDARHLCYFVIPPSATRLTITIDEVTYEIPAGQLRPARPFQLPPAADHQGFPINVAPMFRGYANNGAGKADVKAEFQKDEKPNPTASANPTPPAGNPANF